MLNSVQIQNIKQIAKNNDAYLTISEEQGQFYINFSERIADAYGEEFTDKAKKVESQIMNLLDCDGALMQSEVDEISYNTMAFNINN